MYKIFPDSLHRQDPEVFGFIEGELTRQRRNLELIASENIVSPAVIQAMSNCLTNKYAEGLPGKRYYGGCSEVDKVEQLAIDRAKTLFGAQHVNVQPHSGAQANQCAYFTFVNPGDTVLGMNLANGGHLTHGSPVNMSGKHYNIVPYGVDEQGFIDYDQLRDLAREHRPKMIIAGASAYPRTIHFDRFRDIADEVGAVLFVDMAHIAGLVSAGLHPSPIGIADVTTTTTHKTLRGPRGGMILCNDDNAKAIDKSVFPGVQGGPLMHVIAAKAVCFGEALKPDFKTYQEQVVKNSKALANGLLKRGFDLVSGGTDNHLCLVDLRKFNVTGKEMEKRLDEIYITVNKNAIPNDPQSPFITSGIRVGTPAVTTRGLKETDMDIIAEQIYMAATDQFKVNSRWQEMREAVAELCRKYPLYD